MKEGLEKFTTSTRCIKGLTIFEHITAHDTLLATDGEAFGYRKETSETTSV